MVIQQTVSEEAALVQAYHTLVDLDEYLDDPNMDLNELRLRARLACAALLSAFGETYLNLEKRGNENGNGN